MLARTFSVQRDLSSVTAGGIYSISLTPPALHDVVTYKASGPVPRLQSGQGKGSSVLISADCVCTSSGPVPRLQSGQGNGSSALISADCVCASSGPVPRLQSGQGKGSSVRFVAEIARNWTAKMEV